LLLYLSLFRTLCKEKDSRTGGKKSFYFILAYFFPLVVNFFTKIFRNFGILGLETGRVIGYNGPVYA
jgi:hypothetical protein